MNRDERKQLENLLRELPLHRPSDRLDSRVRAVRRRRPGSWNRLGRGVAAAAALAVAAGLLWMLAWSRREVEPRRPQQPIEPPAIASSLPVSPERDAGEELLPPVRIEQVWSTLNGEEVVQVDDAPPMRRVHHQVYRHVRWIDERRQVQIEWAVPTEQVVLAPLEYN